MVFARKKSPVAETALMDPPAILIEESEASSSKDSSSKDSSSCSDPTTTHNSVKSDGTKSAPLTAQETKAVNRSKILVYLALLLAAGAVGALTYFFTSREEQQDFEREFSAYADEVVAMAESNARGIFGQLHGLSTTITSFALSANETWPNVTLPHFDLRAREAEEISGIELIVFSPVVTKENRKGWEEYAWTHQNWIDEDLLYHDGGEDLHPGTIYPNIYRYSEDNYGEHGDRRRLVTEYEEGFYTPVWQLGPGTLFVHDENAIAFKECRENWPDLTRLFLFFISSTPSTLFFPSVPSNATIINLDLNTHPAFKNTIAEVLQIEHTLLSQVVDLDFLLEHSDVHFTNDDHPRSFILQPVYEDFYGTRVVGFLIGELAWEIFFVDILPQGTNGILVDVQGTCGAEFTYDIEGHEAIYWGEGDRHDPKYDYLKQTYEFAEFARYDGEDDDAANHCEYTFKVYPTAIFEAPYHTSKPALYTTVVVLVFIFTALVFATYDYMVRHVRTTTSIPLCGRSLASPL